MDENDRCLEGDSSARHLYGISGDYCNWRPIGCAETKMGVGKGLQFFRWDDVEEASICERAFASRVKEGLKGPQII